MKANSKKSTLVITAIVLFMSVCLGVKIFYNHLNPEPSIIGPHPYLLEEHSLEKKKKYLIEHDIIDYFLMTYELTYEIFTNGHTTYEDGIPILNPDYFQNIAAVSCTIPFKKGLYTSIEAPFVIDPDWVKKQKVSGPSTLITVTYLFYQKPGQYMENTLTLKDLQESSVALNFKKDSDYEFIYTLISNTPSLQFNENIKINDMIKAIALYLKRNVNYPVTDNLDPLRHQFINIKNASKSLKLRIGVCEDNVFVFNQFMKYYGIDSVTQTVLMPKSYYDEFVPQDDVHFRPHAVAKIIKNNKAYLIDLTTQRTDQTQKVRLSNELTITASEDLSENLFTYPTLIEPKKFLNVEGTNTSQFRREFKIMIEPFK